MSGYCRSSGHRLAPMSEPVLAISMMLPSQALLRRQQGLRTHAPLSISHDLHDFSRSPAVRTTFLPGLLAGAVAFRADGFAGLRCVRRGFVAGIAPARFRVGGSR